MEIVCQIPVVSSTRRCVVNKFKMRLNALGGYIQIKKLVFQFGTACRIPNSNDSKASLNELKILTEQGNSPSLLRLAFNLSVTSTPLPPYLNAWPNKHRQLSHLTFNIIEVQSHLCPTDSSEAVALVGWPLPYLCGFTGIQHYLGNSALTRCLKRFPPLCYKNC